MVVGWADADVLRFHSMENSECYFVVPLPRRSISMRDAHLLFVRMYFVLLFRGAKCLSLALSVRLIAASLKCWKLKSQLRIQKVQSVKLAIFAEIILSRLLNSVLSFNLFPVLQCTYSTLPYLILSMIFTSWNNFLVSFPSVFAFNLYSCLKFLPHLRVFTRFMTFFHKYYRILWYWFDGPLPVDKVEPFLANSVPGCNLISILLIQLSK